MLKLLIYVLLHTYLFFLKKKRFQNYFLFQCFKVVVNFTVNFHISREGEDESRLIDVVLLDAEGLLLGFGRGCGSKEAEQYRE